MTYCEPRKFFTLNSTLLGILFLVLWFVFPVGGAIDMHFIQPWMDASGQFPLKNNWFLVEINHKLIKYIVIAFYVSLLVTWLMSFKKEKLKPYTWRLGYFFWFSILSTAVVGVLKSHSAHACPWSMTETTTIANTVSYVWNFSATNGHCFPGGHASTGFSLLTGYFVFRKSYQKLAYLLLFLGLTLGFLMGWGQMMRGAHFLSHNLWTAWVIYTFNLIMYRIFYNKI